jgi:hypothetical protein
MAEHGVKLNVSEDENFPYYSATFADDPRPAGPGFYPNVELTEAEAADLRRVRAEHEAWQRKLGELHQAWQRGNRRAR